MMATGVKILIKIIQEMPLRLEFKRIAGVDIRDLGAGDDTLMLGAEDIIKGGSCRGKKCQHANKNKKNKFMPALKITRITQ